MSKRFAGLAILIAAVVSLLGGCASDITDTTTSTSQSSETVPGEKIPDDQGLAPAPGTRPGGNMRW